MTITREQVADLQPGDVVEIRNANYTDYTMRGTVFPDSFGGLRVGPDMIRTEDGAPALWAKGKNYTLTVVSRAPRPLYVNHPRTEPVPGDVVRDADSDDARTWTRARMDFGAPWYASQGRSAWASLEMPTRLRLLVDGETGQVVP